MRYGRPLPGAVFDKRAIVGIGGSPFSAKNLTNLLWGRVVV